MFLVKCQEAVSIFVQAQEDVALYAIYGAQALAVSLLAAASWSTLWQMVSSVAGARWVALPGVGCGGDAAKGRLMCRLTWIRVAATWV